MFQVQRKQKYMHHRARERQEEKRTPRPQNNPFIPRYMDAPARLNVLCIVFRTAPWPHNRSVLRSGAVLEMPVRGCSDDDTSASFIFITSFFVLK